MFLFFILLSTISVIYAYVLQQGNKIVAWTCAVCAQCLCRRDPFMPPVALANWMGLGRLAPPAPRLWRPGPSKGLRGGLRDGGLHRNTRAEEDPKGEKAEEVVEEDEVVSDEGAG